MTELLNPKHCCPFCGKEAVVIENFVDSRIFGREVISHQTGCKTKRCRGNASNAQPIDSRVESIAQWDTRTQIDDDGPEYPDGPWADGYEIRYGGVKS